MKTSSGSVGLTLWVVVMISALGATMALGQGPVDGTAVDATPDAAVQSVVLHPVKDTWVDALSPGSSWGSADYLRVGNGVCPGGFITTDARALIQWDLSSIPPGAEILEARLRMYQLGYSGDPSLNIRMRMLRADGWWPENMQWSDLPALGGGVGYAWSTGGTGWRDLWNMRTRVQEWVSGSVPNHGVEVWDDMGSFGTQECNQRVFDSREGANKPQLVVEYRVPENTPTPTRTRTPTRTAVVAHRVYLPIVLKRSPGVLSITLGKNNIERGLVLDYGGDADTEVVLAGSPAVEARRTGNGQALPAADGNQAGDSYLQIRVGDSHIYAGSPTTRVRIVVEHLDQGSDTFSLQYDALSGGPFSDGRFKDAGAVSKTNSGAFRTVVFTLNDASFGNRDNGADFRISDNGDGAETIRRVTVTLLFP